MLTAASIIYFVICHVLTQPVRRLAVRQSAPVYATAGLLVAMCIAVYGAAWPQPEVQRNFREVVESVSLSLETGAMLHHWQIPKADVHDHVHGLIQNIPVELMPENYLGFDRQPLIVQTPTLPGDGWVIEESTPLLVQASVLSKLDVKTAPPQNIEMPKPLEKGVKYTIQSGDNLWYVAKRFGVKHEKLVAYNPLVNPRAMQPGDKIYIPGVSEPMLKNIITNRMIMPIPNMAITSKYGMRKHPLGGGLRFHHGVDFRAKYGTPIKAVLPGVVKTSAYLGSKGRTVIIKHDNGLETVYAHCSQLKAKRGQRVNQGETIGYVGNTGRVTGTHLHFEVLKAGKSQDPIQYLPYKPRYVKGGKSRS